MNRISFMVKLAVVLLGAVGVAFAQDQPPLHVARCALSSSATDTYVGAATPTLSSWATGQVVIFTPNFTNVGAASLDCGPGAKSIVKTFGTTAVTPGDGDLVSGASYMLYYNGTNLEIFSRLGSVYIPNRVNSGSSDPGTCTAGDVFVNTNSTPVFKLCGASNTWATVGSGGGGGISAWAASTAYTSSSIVYTVLTVNSVANRVVWKAGGSCTSGSTFDATEISNCTWTVVAGETVTHNFTASGTWTMPLGAKVIHVCVIGPGGGGGSGSRQATSVARGGGGGGGSGGRSCATFSAANIPATVPITVGTGGAGGAARTADTTGGAAGSAGSGASIFGNYLKANAGTGGGAGTTGASTGGTGGTGLISSGGNGNPGQAGSATGGVTINYASASGAGASGAAASSTTNSAGNAGIAAPSFYGGTLTAGNGGTTGGTAATAGSQDDVAMITSGGGAGAYRTGVAGGDGQPGLAYGAGGSGGAGSDNGFNSGAGGNGADGYVRVIVTF